MNNRTVLLAKAVIKTAVYLISNNIWVLFTSVNDLNSYFVTIYCQCLFIWFKGCGICNLRATLERINVLPEGTFNMTINVTLQLKHKLREELSIMPSAAAAKQSHIMMAMCANT